jgi:hypothetical protein
MTATVLAVGAVSGWLVASGRLTAAIAQDKQKAQVALPAATPSVLPRPDFHFPGSVGWTYLDSDPPQFPQPVQPPKTIPLQFSLGEGMDIGMDVGSPVDFTCKLPFPFTGKIEKVTIDLK